MVSFYMQAYQISTEISFWLRQFYTFFLSVIERWPDDDPLASKYAVTIRKPELVLSTVFILFIN